MSLFVTSVDQHSRTVTLASTSLDVPLTVWRYSPSREFAYCIDYQRKMVGVVRLQDRASAFRQYHTGFTDENIERYLRRINFGATRHHYRALVRSFERFLEHQINQLITG